MDGHIRIRTYADPLEATAARGRLTEAGIGAVLSSDDLFDGTLAASLGPRGVDLYVLHRDAERAVAVLSHGRIPDGDDAAVTEANDVTPPVVVTGAQEEGRTPSATSAPRQTDADQEARLLAAAEMTLRPVPVGATYQLGLLLVAATMLLLPVLYVALIVALAYGVFWYAVHSPGTLFGQGSGGGLWQLVLYVGPIVAGGTSVLFMIKPILAHPPAPPPSRTLSPEEEPLLHGFVARLCKALGAPVPREIRVNMDVNASASFRRGVRSMVSSDLVLTLGLPFVAGLTVTQLAGVLAHEFGHFSQAVAMRFSYFIGAVNHWFARVVFERDAWDESLRKAMQENPSGHLQLILQLATFMVWLSRRILWLLMHVGHAMSAYLSRQMEYNADRHQLQVVGSEGFRATYFRMTVLQFAQQGSGEQVNELMADGRLVDNLASLAQVHADQLEAQEEVRREIAHHVLLGSTELFDTHPSGGDRIREAERQSVPPKMDCSAPATDLFRNFDELAVRASASLYSHQLGDAVASYMIVPTAEAAAGLVAARQAAQAADRVLYGGGPMSCGVAPKSQEPTLPTSVEAGVHALTQARERARQVQASVLPLMGKYEAACFRGFRLDDALVAVGAGVHFSPEELGLSTKDAAELIRLKQSVQEERKAARERLSPIVTAIHERVDAAVSLARHPEVCGHLGDAARTVHDYRAIAAALEALVQNWEHITDLNTHVRQLSMLIGAAQQYGEQEHFQEEAGRVVKDAHDILQLVCQRLHTITYPYDHARGHVTVADYAMPETAHATIQVIEDAGGALERLHALYGRCWRDLASLVERVEAVVGLPELDLAVRSEEPSAA